LIPIATSLAPVVAQGIGALINGGKVQNLSQEDLQWGGLAGLAGALAPVAAQVIGGMLQAGGTTATVFAFTKPFMELVRHVFLLAIFRAQPLLSHL